MRNYRVVKIIVALTLTAAVFLYSTVFASAYVPIWRCDSSEWIIDSPDIYRAAYPIRPYNHKLDEIVFSYSEFFEETYYLSDFWNDDYKTIDDTVVQIPPCPSDYSVAFGNPLEDHDMIAVSVGNNIYLAFFDGVNQVYVDDTDGVLWFDTEGRTGEINIYELNYPYTSWSLSKWYDFYDSVPVLAFNTSDSGPRPCHVVWSTVDVYNLERSDVIFETSLNKFFGQYYTVEFAKPISVLEGNLYCTISAAEFEKVSYTLSAFVFDKCGFIIGTDTSFVDIEYGLTIRQDGQLLFSDVFMSYNYNEVDSDNYLPVGSHAFDQIVQKIDYKDVNLVGSNIDLYFTFSFASDGFNLFFPGSVELVEYESFNQQQQHNEVIGAIQNGFDSIMNADVELEKIVVDTSNVDNFVQEQDDIINGIYDDTDKIIEDNLPDGYENYEDYLEDNIDYFNENLSDAFKFVKKMFEHIVDFSGQAYLILFCLSFGFGMYVLGRRLT